MGSNPSKLQRPDSGDNATAGSDEYRTSIKHKQYKFVCTTCVRNDKHVSACIYCKSCQDHLCFRCLQWHTKYRDKHVDDLIGQDEMQKLGVQGSPMMPTEKCLDHDDKLWNMFCQKDDIAGCTQCMDEKHRSCKSVIPRSTQQIEAANRRTPNDGQVGGTLKQMSVDDGQVDGRKREPHQSDDLQVGGKLRQPSADDDQVDGQIRERDTHSERSQVDVKFEIVALSQNDDQVEGSKKINKRSTTTSTDDGQVPGSLMTDVEKQTRHEDDRQMLGTRSQHTGLYSVESGRDVNVGLKRDTKKCLIHDMSEFFHGFILMLDLNNDKLKVLDSNLNIIDDYEWDHVDVQYNSRGICMINDSKAVLSIDDSYIQYMTIGDKIEIGRRIELDHRCCGLVYSSGELYVSDMKTNIHVYTVDGKKLRTIETGLRDEHDDWLEWLTVSKDGSRIYITSYEYGIVCLDRLSGEVIWKVNDTDDNKFTGVCVDRYNNILVCRYGKHDVVQFSPSGQLTGVVINKSDGLQRPWSIGIDEVSNRLIVGLDFVDVVKVFDFKS